MSRKFWIGIVLILGLAGVLWQIPTRAEMLQVGIMTETHGFSPPPPPWVTTTTIISDQPDDSQIGETVKVVIHVETSIPDVGSPVGWVTIATDPGNYSCRYQHGLLNYCSLTIPIPGSYSIHALFEGNDYWLSSSDSESHQVTLNRPTITLISDNPDPSLPGETFTTTFSATSLLGDPTGFMTITVQDSEITCVGELSEGIGSCAMSLPELGKYNLIATYPGDENFQPGTNSVEHTVTEFVMRNLLYIPLIVWRE